MADRGRESVPFRRPGLRALRRPRGRAPGQTIIAPREAGRLLRELRAGLPAEANGPGYQRFPASTVERFELSAQRNSARFEHAQWNSVRRFEQLLQGAAEIRERVAKLEGLVEGGVMRSASGTSRDPKRAEQHAPPRLSAPSNLRSDSLWERRCAVCDLDVRLGTIPSAWKPRTSSRTPQAVRTPVPNGLAG